MLLPLAVAMSLLAATALLTGQAAPVVDAIPGDEKRKPLDVIYVPTPTAVVREMLTLAEVTPRDVVYDLGSGDGRIVIAAVKEFGAARGVGIELDPLRISEAVENARVAGVSDRVEFRREDLFEVDLSPATVIAMYLLPDLNVKLLPKFQALKRGTRIVSHNYGFGEAWRPEETRNLRTDLVLRWTVGRR